jgi:hypothetical protein
MMRRGAREQRQFGAAAVQNEDGRAVEDGDFHVSLFRRGRRMDRPFALCAVLRSDAICKFGADDQHLQGKGVPPS